MIASSGPCHTETPSCVFRFDCALILDCKSISLTRGQYNMWWGKGQDKPREVAKEVEPKPNGKDAANTRRSGAEFDPEKLPRREKLPDRLQKIIEKSDDEENFFDEVVDG